MRIRTLGDQPILAPTEVTVRERRTPGWKVVAPIHHSACGALRGALFFEVDDHLVMKLRSGEVVTTLASSIFDEVRRWHEVRTRTEWREALQLARVSLCAKAEAGFVNREVPGTRLQPGDLLVITKEPAGFEPFGRMYPLELGELASIRQAFIRAGCRGNYHAFDHPAGPDAFPVRRITPYEWGRIAHHHPEGFFYDRRRWALSKRPWPHKVFLVQPVRPSEPRAVNAISDDGAIFELLSEVGGRMPTKGRS